MDYLAIGRGHGFEGRAGTALLDRGRHLLGEAAQGFGSLLAVAAHVDVDAAVPGSRLMVDNGARQVLDRQQGGALRTDQQTEIRSPQVQVDGVLVGSNDLDVGLDAELRRELGEELQGDPSLLL